MISTSKDRDLRRVCFHYPQRATHQGAWPYSKFEVCRLTAHDFVFGLCSDPFSKASKYFHGIREFASTLLQAPSSWMTLKNPEYESFLEAPGRQELLVLDLALVASSKLAILLVLQLSECVGATTSYNTIGAFLPARSAMAAHLVSKSLS